MSSNPSNARNAGKTPMKSIDPTDSQSKKQKKKRGSGAMVGGHFRSAVKKCLKETSPDGTIKLTEKTLAILCQIAHTLLTDVTEHAVVLAKRANRETIGVEDMIAAFELTLTGELRMLCVREIRSVITKTSNKPASRK